jgi:hypothetical protein
MNRRCSLSKVSMSAICVEGWRMEDCRLERLLRGSSTMVKMSESEATAGFGELPAHFHLVTIR